MPRWRSAQSLAADPALTSTYARPRWGTRVLLLGTSVEYQNGTGPDSVDPVSGAAAISGRGWFNWANAFLGQRLTLVANGGISGSTSAQQLAALPAALAASASDWVFLGGPVNDPATGVSSATTIANLTAMLDLIKADGRATMLLTCVPSTNYNTNGTNRQALSDVNRFIRTLPFTRNDVVVVDAWRVLVDQATGNPVTLFCDGTVHPSDSGALRIGREVASVMDRHLPARPPQLLPTVDPRNICGNPTFASSGTGWAVLGGAVTTPSYGAAADRATANAATLVIAGNTDAAEHGIQYTEAVGGGRYAAGDVVQASARFQFSNMVPVGVKGSFFPFLRLWPRLADNSFTSPALCFMTASSDQPATISGVPAAGDLVAITYRITLPPTVANLYIAAGWMGAASGTVVVSDLAAYKVA